MERHGNLANIKCQAVGVSVDIKHTHEIQPLKNNTRQDFKRTLVPHLIILNYPVSCVHMDIN